MANEQARAAYLKRERNKVRRSRLLTAARLVYLYPGLSLEEADIMASGDAKLMFVAAEVERQKFYLGLLEVMASANSKESAEKMHATIKENIEKLEREL